MKKNKIKSTFLRCRAGDLLKLGRRIVGSIKDNPHFPNPAPALADVEKALNEYEVALVNAGGRDRTMVAIKDEKQAILRQLLTELANYVSHTCKGDRAMLLSSGYDLSQEKGAFVMPAVIESISIDVGLSGQATLRVRKIPGAGAYVFQYTTDPAASGAAWHSATLLKREYTFIGLSSSVKHWFRIIAIGPNGQSVYSDPVSRIIQ